MKVRALILITIALTLLLADPSARAATSGDYEYTVDKAGAATITAYTGSAANLTIPDTLDGHPVTAIGESAFSGNQSLMSLTIPGSVADIGDYAFEYCAALERVSIGAGVESLGDNPFFGNIALKSIEVAPGNRALEVIDQVLFLRPENKLVICLDSRPVGEYTVPDGTEIIGVYAFLDCGSITGIILPDSVRVIETSAFYYCTALEYVELGGGIESIGTNPFIKCTSLHDVRLADGNEAADVVDGMLISKSDNALISCLPGPASGRLTVPEGVKIIGSTAFFGCDGITEIALPDSVVRIEVGAFSDCRALRKINIPENVNAIGYEAFYNCSSLYELTIPEGVAYIDEGVFLGCDALTLKVYPDSYAAKYAGEAGVPYEYVSAPAPADYKYAINRDGGVTITGYTGSATDLTIPDTLDGRPVTAIGEGAFLEHQSLISLTIPDGVTDIEDYAFEYCALLEYVSIGAGVKSVGLNPFYRCGALGEIEVAPGNSALEVIDRALISRADNRLILRPCGPENEEYAVPDGTEIIGDFAFMGCSTLTSVTIPDSVKYIGEGAFLACTRLEYVDLGRGIERFDSNPFAGCISLREVRVAEDHEILSVLEGSMLISRPDMRVICYMGGLEDEACQVPEGVKVIGEYAFFGCYNLMEVTLPGSVLSIENAAFAHCVGLKSVVIPDSVSAIVVGAFVGNPELTLTVPPGSYPEMCAVSEGIPFVYSEDPRTATGDYNYVLEGGGAKITGYTGAATDLTIPDTLDGHPVRAIGESAFYGNETLVSVVIPDGVQAIDSYAFEYCSALERASIGAGASHMGANPFFGCVSLISIDLSPDNRALGVIDQALFSLPDGRLITYPGGLSNLEYTVPDFTEIIGAYAFLNCRAITGVTIPDSVRVIEDAAFLYCARLMSVDIGGGVEAVGQNPFAGCASLTTVLVAGDHLTLEVLGGALIMKPDMRLISYLAGGGSARYEVPAGIRIIGDAAFFDATDLTEITLPDSVTIIEGGAFMRCAALRAVNISAGVTSIGDGAFLDCSSLTTLTLPESVTEIAYDAFNGCDSLTLTVYSGSYAAGYAIVVGIPREYADPDGGEGEYHHGAGGWNYDYKNPHDDHAAGGGPAHRRGR